MAQSTPKTIILKGAERCMQVEYQAGGTITPGHLVALNSSGALVVHPTAGGTAPERMFALEDDAQGRGISDNYDSTTYKNVRAMVCPPGTEVYAWLAANAAIAIGDKLESAGNGQLREHVGQQSPITSPGVAVRTGQVVAVALEAKDSTSPVGVTRIKVRVV